MDDNQIPISYIPSFGQAIRVPTRLKRLSLTRVSGEKTFVNIDVNIGVTSNPNVETFNNYLGVVARERLSILFNSWDDVSEVDRNML